MAQSERILLTELEIAIPKTAKWEKPFVGLLFIGLKLVARLSLEPKLIPQAIEGLSLVKTLLEAGDDFRNGRISGRVALPDEREPQPAFDLGKLAEGRLKAKRLKGDN